MQTLTCLAVGLVLLVGRLLLIHCQTMPFGVALASAILAISVLTLAFSLAVHVEYPFFSQSQHDNETAKVAGDGQLDVHKETNVAGGGRGDNGNNDKDPSVDAAIPPKSKSSVLPDGHKEPSLDTTPEGDTAAALDKKKKKNTRRKERQSKKKQQKKQQKKKQQQQQQQPGDGVDDAVVAATLSRPTPVQTTVAQTIEPTHTVPTSGRTSDDVERLMEKPLGEGAGEATIAEGGWQPAKKQNRRRKRLGNAVESAVTKG